MHATHDDVGSSKGESENLVTDLRDHLAVAFPEYMIPSAFVTMAALPLTHNGKLDRSALPAPDGASFVRRAYEPAKGETEMALASIWQELLGVERVGRNDHFFELGGHSLLAVRLLGRVRQSFGAQMELSSLFKHPELSSFAKRVLIASLKQKVDAIGLRQLMELEGNK
jgi:acyl carrier protein